MHPKQFVAIFLILAAASCSRSGKMQRDQQQYDVVQEGSADRGVTSTINGPGETTPPLTTSTASGSASNNTTADNNDNGYRGTADDDFVSADDHRHCRADHDGHQRPTE